MSARAAFLALLLVGLTGCGSEGVVEPEDDGPTAPEPCAVGERTTDDGCLPPGIAPEACAEGFAGDGLGGCEPMLPTAPCEDGTTALPGDAACRPIADCGPEPWGLIETGADTVYVDAASPGGDGTPASPLSTLAEAVAAAPSGATVAVAAGSYQGNLVLGDAPLTIWGRCPALVSVSGGFRIAGPGEVTLRGLGISGSGGGVDVERGTARLTDLWVHDLTNIGIVVESTIGNPASAVLEDVHIARVVDVGLLVLGAEVQATDLVSRDVSLAPSGKFGRPVDVEAIAGFTGSLTVDRLVAERGFEHGVYVSGSSAAIGRAVVRDIAYNDDVDPGYAITARANSAGQRSSLQLSDAVLERAVATGINLAGADALIERVVIRHVEPASTGMLSGRTGYGLSAVTSSSGGTSSTTVRDSLIEQVHTVGALGSGGLLDVEGLWVRDVFPEPANGWFGRGVAMQAPVVLTPTELRVAHSRIERVADAGIAVFDAAGSADNVAIDGVAAAQDATFGDGIDVFGGGTVTPTMTVTRSSVFRAARAGIANFASVVGLVDSRIGCNGIDVNGESTDTVPFVFDDQGGNLCGCETEEPCKVLSTDLQPPGVPTAPDL